MAASDRMNTGCGWLTALCIHVFVLDQTMTASPNYFGGSMDDPSPDGRSAECVKVRRVQRKGAASWQVWLAAYAVQERKS